MAIDLSKLFPGTKTGQNSFLGFTLPDTGFTESKWNTGKYAYTPPAIYTNAGTKYEGSKTLGLSSDRTTPAPTAPKPTKPTKPSGGSSGGSSGGVGYSVSEVV